MSTLHLTVDDAPSAALPAKLDVLAAHDVPAILFCEGRKLDHRPDIARRAIEVGFHLGNHAYSHTTASDLSIEGFRDEVERTETLIEDAYAAAGVERPATLFRFPNGDAGGERKAEFRDVLTEFGFVPPATVDGETGSAALRRSDVDGAWEPGDRDWAWTLHVADWELETVAALESEIDAIADRLDRPGDDLFLFHDHGDDTARFETLVDRSREHGADFGDPLALVE